MRIGLIGPGIEEAEVLDDFVEEQPGSGPHRIEMRAVTGGIDRDDIGERGIGVDIEARDPRSIRATIIGSTATSPVKVREVRHRWSPAFPLRCGSVIPV
ncbi:hypothetical protein JCM18882A_00380 [Brevibacterium metallidurans]|uniref:Uncharacterized protein n=2 Tax=Brevibacterium TaxID=1696 RepID=A0ABP9U274_9MICO